MKVLILCGSPHKDGTTNKLANAFISGVDLKKHKIEKFYLDSKNIEPCSGCDYCQKNAGMCCKRDDMMELYGSLLTADAVVFASPLYYFGMPAQMKLFIDRFYAINDELRKQTYKKAILLSAGADEDPKVFEAISKHFDIMVDYLNWQPSGKVLALGCAVKEDLEKTTYLEDAKVLAENL